MKQFENNSSETLIKCKKQNPLFLSLNIDYFNVCLFLYSWIGETQCSSRVNKTLSAQCAVWPEKKFAKCRKNYIGFYYFLCLQGGKISLIWDSKVLTPKEGFLEEALKRFYLLHNRCCIVNDDQCDQKNCQMSIKVAKQWFHYKNYRFWQLYKKAWECENGAN